jgi:hypothetical protein
VLQRNDTLTTRRLEEKLYIAMPIMSQAAADQIFGSANSLE